MQNITKQNTNRVCKGCLQSFHYDEFWDRVSARRPDNNFCQACQFWLEQWADRDTAEVVRAEGSHYRIGEPQSKVKGFGGAHVVVRFADGRVVETDNIWHQGTVPQVWREQYGLADNATVEFVR